MSGHRVRVGGTQLSGWWPEGAADPLPPPVREVTFDLEIHSVGSGYLLCYASRGGDLYGDTWHKTVGEAEEAAARDFGVLAEQWESG